MRNRFAIALFLFAASLPAAPSIGAASDELTDVLTRTVAASGLVQTQGFNIVHVEVDRLARGGSYRYPIRLEAGIEYRILGVGAAGISDLDLILEDEDGSPLRADRDTDSTPLLEFRSNANATVYLRTKTEGAYRRQPLFVNVIARRSPGRTVSAGADALADILAKATTAAATLAADGRRVSHIEVDILRNGGNYTWTRRLTGNTDYAVMGIGGDGIRDLDLVVRDANGRPHSSDTDTDNSPVLTFTTGRTAEVSIESRANRVSGGSVYFVNVLAEREAL